MMGKVKHAAAHLYVIETKPVYIDKQCQAMFQCFYNTGSTWVRLIRSLVQDIPLHLNPARQIPLLNAPVRKVHASRAIIRQLFRAMG